AGLPDACAAALVRNWEASAREVARRRVAAARWRGHAVTRGWTFPEPERADAVRGELRLAGLVPEGERAATVAARLGGGAMPGYPLTLGEVAALRPRVRLASGDAGARELVARLVTLPTT
ncbi:MAG: hypothetical protein MUC69_10625, partial [Gemmatimonadales bacterium]|nr:hypothetical protein [Gemmatimonadales bacterium]